MEIAERRKKVSGNNWPQHNALRRECNKLNQNPDEFASALSFNSQLRHGSESPVNKGRNPSDAPICNLFGNVWQWCSDHFNPLEGTRIHRYYNDFSSPCYDGKHQIILGGSFISSGDEASAWARFHFRPHFFSTQAFAWSICLMPPMVVLV